MDCLDKAGGFLFKTEHHLRGAIEKAANKKTVWGFLSSRIMAVAISIFAAINVLHDLVYMTFHSLAALAFMITHFKSPLKYCSTTRNIAVFFTEFFRHLGGAVGGSIVGIVTPKQSAQFFLPPDQSGMETRKGNMTIEQADRLYTMTGTVHDLFGKYGIEYCMTGGTQLGAARHDGIIPWDDDVDLFAKETDKDKIIALKQELEEKGIGMVECHLGFKFFDLNGNDVEEKNLKYKYPFIDICMVHEDKKGHITYVNEHFKQNYAGEYLLKSEWEKRELQTFGPLKLYGAPKPEKFCKRMYGENVFQYGYQLLNHRTFKLEIPRKYYLRKEPDGKCKPVKTTLVAG